MHRYLSTDNGLQCYSCGIVLDYGTADDDDARTYGPENDALEAAARSLAFGLCQPGADARAHHFVLEGTAWDRPNAYDYVLVCAYDSVTVGPETLPAGVPFACTGD